MKVTRRTALAGLTTAGLAATACAKTPPQQEEKISPVFRHGVASGDPDASSVVLWTRIESAEDAAPVQWIIARDKDFTNIAGQGEIMARADADHTVKVIAGDLSPGETYYYRFSSNGDTSPTGRTRTLPVGAVDKLGIALVSCSNFQFGYFNAYDAIAKDDAIDFVLHTGDYIYEYGADEWGGETAKVIGREHEPPHEIITLDDYRKRHAQYKRDAGSLAMHAAHPLLCLWDDHESANNPWIGGAQNHTNETEGDWIARRDASLQAYFEWMPVREPEAGMTRAQLWRAFVFGDLATLVTLETRHTGRGEQVDYSKYFDQIKTEEDAATFKREIIDDPDRSMISKEMDKFLSESLTASVDGGQPWRMIGNASPIARMLVPDVAALGVDPAKQNGAPVPGATADLFWKGRWNMPFYTDTWDGYPAAREAFYDTCRQAGAGDLLVLTGDSHSFWANELYDDENRPMGLELGTAGVSSPGDFVDSGWDHDTAERLDRIFEQELEEVVWTDNFHQGYVRVVLTPAAATASFIAVDTVLTPTYKSFVLREDMIHHHGETIGFAKHNDE